MLGGAGNWLAVDLAQVLHLLRARMGYSKSAPPAGSMLINFASVVIAVTPVTGVT